MNSAGRLNTIILVHDELFVINVDRQEKFYLSNVHNPSTLIRDVDVNVRDFRSLM